MRAFRPSPSCSFILSFVVAEHSCDSASHVSVFAGRNGGMDETRNRQSKMCSSTMLGSVYIFSCLPKSALR
ncbi:uncharacterized protein EV422DRAFT_517333 [Fimicolochytrium jonesii]|uniref:uncharacterized protein n=1 Tax=Fimicolochytrium jonesii TaxID=1396493 RepID=UPI0022FE1718|nr:uncharacterized protein EV422DRAFT_517333 [Fimicolochytrium jonesii]KAI8825074.1 hypothetical protein EV422DRAFT_517333 [Fimicolochytrium jonesii]